MVHSGIPGYLGYLVVYQLETCPNAAIKINSASPLVWSVQNLVISPETIIQVFENINFFLRGSLGY